MSQNDEWADLSMKIRVEDGQVVCTPTTAWQRKTLLANKFKLMGENEYARLDSDVARYVAETIRSGGV